MEQIREEACADCGHAQIIHCDLNPRQKNACEHKHADYSGRYTDEKGHVIMGFRERCGCLQFIPSGKFLVECYGKMIPEEKWLQMSKHLRKKW